jgi:alanine dehydrogenase
MSILNISVFEPQDINGEIIEPLCIPAMPSAVAHTVAGATNLLWFSFHLCLAEKNRAEAIRIANMLKVVVDEGTITSDVAPLLIYEDAPKPKVVGQTN